MSAAWLDPPRTEFDIARLRDRWGTDGRSDRGPASDLRGRTFGPTDLAFLTSLLKGPDPPCLDACRFQGLVFDSLDSAGLRARSAEFNGCVFSRCRLRDWDLAYSHLWECQFDDCTILSTSLTGSRLWGGGIRRCEVREVRLRNTTLARGPAGRSMLRAGEEPEFYELAGNRFIGVDLQLSRWVGVALRGTEVLGFQDTNLLGVEWVDLVDLDGRALSALARVRRRQHEEAGWPVAERPVCFLHPRRDLCSIPLVPSANEVFVSIPYDGEHLRLHLEVIGRAIDAAGLTRNRMMDRFYPGSVTCAECQHVQEAFVLVADVSVVSPTVYLEIGLAFGRSVPVILVAKAGSSVPVSIGHLRRIEYSDDLDLLRRLTDALRSVPKRPPPPGSSLPPDPP